MVIVHSFSIHYEWFTITTFKSINLQVYNHWFLSYEFPEKRNWKTIIYINKKTTHHSLLCREEFIPSVLWTIISGSPTIRFLQPKIFCGSRYSLIALMAPTPISPMVFFNQRFLNLPTETQKAGYERQCNAWK